MLGFAPLGELAIGEQPDDPFSTPLPWDDASRPHRARKAAAIAVALAASGSFSNPWDLRAPTVDRYLTRLEEPVRLNLKRGLPAHRAPFCFVVLGAADVAERVSEDKWHQPWSEPKRFKRNARLHVALGASGPFQSLLPTTLLPGPNVYGPWHYPWSEPKRFPRALPTATAAAKEFQSLLPETLLPGPDVYGPWHQPWSEPKRFMPRLAADKNDYEWSLSGSSPPLVSFGYYNWLSEPKRFPKGMAAERQMVQPDVFLPPQVSFSYYNWLAQPVKLRKEFLPTHQQMFWAGDTADTLLPRRLATWFNPLSEPVRFPKRLRTDLHMVGTMEFTLQPNIAELVSWHNALSEPVRFKVGLKSWLQMTTAMPHRHLPTPDITGTMAATEINSDVFEGSINITDGVDTGGAVSARVSITEVDTLLAAISIRGS